MPVDPTLTAPTEAPCQPWCTADDMATCGDIAGIDSAVLEWSINLSGRILWAASGRRYGLCLKSVLPCYSGSHCGYSGGVCGCYLPELRDIPGPIAAVEEIIYDGVVLDPSAYKIKTHGEGARRRLLRVDGDGWWCCNDIERDPSVVPAVPSLTCPSWQITYWRGRALPLAAVASAAMLATQIAKTCTTGSGDDSCGTIQPGLAQIARRGVTIEYDADPGTSITSGYRTGLFVPDAWLDTVNPHKLPRPSTVASARHRSRRMWSFVDSQVVV